MHAEYYTLNSISLPFGNLTPGSCSFLLSHEEGPFLIAIFCLPYYRPYQVRIIFWWPFNYRKYSNTGSRELIQWEGEGLVIHPQIQGTGEGGWGV